MQNVQEFQQVSRTNRQGTDSNGKPRPNLQESWHEADHDLNDREPMDPRSQADAHVNPTSSRSRGSNKRSKHSARGQSKKQKRHKERDNQINNLNLRTDRLGMSGAGGVAANAGMDQHSQSRMTAGSRTNRTNNYELMSQREREKGEKEHRGGAVGGLPLQGQ